MGRNSRAGGSWRTCSCDRTSSAARVVCQRSHLCAAGQGVRDHLGLWITIDIGLSTWCPCRGQRACLIAFSLSRPCGRYEWKPVLHLFTSAGLGWRLQHRLRPRAPRSHQLLASRIRLSLRSRMARAVCPLWRGSSPLRAAPSSLRDALEPPREAEGVNGCSRDFRLRPSGTKPQT